MKRRWPCTWCWCRRRCDGRLPVWKAHAAHCVRLLQLAEVGGGCDLASTWWCAASGRAIQKITMGQAKRSVFMVCRRTKATRCSYFVYHFWHGASRCISVSYWLVLTLKCTFFSSTCMYQHLHCTGWILDDLLWRLPFFLGVAFQFGRIKIKINLQQLSAGNSASDLLGMVVCDPFKGCWPPLLRGKKGWRLESLSWTCSGTHFFLGQEVQSSDHHLGFTNYP